MFDHFNPWGNGIPNSHIFDLWAAVKVISPGSMGVIYFFSLSSFLLTYLGVREFDRSGHFSVWRFMQRRVLRIWPLYFTIIAVFILYGLFVKPNFPSPYNVMQSGAGDAWLRQVWVYLVFVSNWVSPRYPEMSVVWSVAIEEQFYLAFPFLFLLGIRNMRVGPIIVALIIVAVAWRAGVIIAKSKLSIYYSTPTYFDVFALGALAGWLTAKNRVPAFFKMPGVGILIGVAVVLFGYIGHTTLHTKNVGAVFLFFGYAVTFACLTLWIVANPQALLARFLRLPTMYFLGVLSFGVYLWHLQARDLVQWQLGAPFTGDALTAIAFTLYALLSVLFAWITYRLVELPFLRLKKRFGGTYDRADTLLQERRPSSGLGEFSAKG